MEQTINIPISFVNPVQEQFYYCNKRNQGFSGGYGNGKSYGASMKAITLLTTFPRYRVAISRYRASDLTKSTMSTFFKLCEPALYNEAYGGRRNDRDGYLRLINGSEIFWLHLDDFSETSLRGLEINTHIGDQMEEVSESVYITIDSRIERWDKVEIPSYLDAGRFPKNPYTGNPMPPSYDIVLCNPDVVTHWIYERYHPDSPKAAAYADTHAYFTASTHDNPAIPETLKAQMRSRDPAWVDRFYWGKWGIAGGAIHYVPSACILEVEDPDPAISARQRMSKNSLLITKTDYDKIMHVVQRDGVKYRVMDHGEAAPTVCLWFAYLSPTVLRSNFGITSKGIHICYREYYMPEKLISYHREAIHALSAGERYNANYADPAIFKKNSQKNGGFWSVADEYITRKITAPPIMWQPADNNEMACRNAVGELLLPYADIYHPVTGEPDSPALYFLKKGWSNPNGCEKVILQTMSARRKKIGSVNGTDIYSDERDPNIEDHAYDPLRYYAIMPKAHGLPEKPTDAPEFSFNRYLGKKRLVRHRIYGR